MKTISIGIDLGTTFSCVAVWDEKMYDAEIIANGDGNRTTPSAVEFYRSGQRLGQAAMEAMLLNPRNTVYGTRRLMGKSYFDESVQQEINNLPFKVVNVNNEPMIQVTLKKKARLMSPEEITSCILRYLRQATERTIKKSVAHCVIAVPVYFNYSQRQAVLDAAKMAGLYVLQLIHEPTAAALAYSMQNRLSQKKKQDDYEEAANHVLVYDWGGATFDVTVLTVDGGGEFKMLATGGHGQLGGQDLTQAMVEHILDTIQKTDRRMHDSDKVRQLTEGCERAKIGLSTATRYILDLADFYGPDKHLHTVIQRARFEELARPKIQQTMAIVQETLSRAGITNVDDILMVGGSSLIPLVHQMITDFFGKAPTTNDSVRPDEAVATGTAIHAAVLTGSMDYQYYGSSVSLYDVAPLSIGTDLSGDVMDVLIERDTLLPVTVTRTYFNSRKKQTRMDIKVYQGERKLASENALLGVVTLDSLVPATQRGGSGVDVTFVLDQQGTLNVQAKCQRTARFDQVQFNVATLTKKMVKRMVAQAADFETHDREHVKKEKARQALEAYCAFVSAMPNDNTRIAIQIDQAAEQAMAWIDEYRVQATKDDYKKKKAQLKSTVETLLNEQELSEDEDDVVYFEEEICFVYD